MIIDCETCVMRDLACGDCVVSFLAEPAWRGRAPELSDAEARAMAVLAGSGLIPPLRMAGGPAAGESGGGPRARPGARTSAEPLTRGGQAAAG